jgi:L,D-peptidoglycan transpeptidase YkuD (ErfK/YbiS/YcfS/YnhG family)
MLPPLLISPKPRSLAAASSSNKTGKSLQTARYVHVYARSRASTRGVLQLGSIVVPCALGRTGRRTVKREGDGASPSGNWPIRRAVFRRDKMFRPCTHIPLSGLRNTDGWCDAPADPNYNRPVRHPYRGSAERLWRDDAVYDLIIIIGHNDQPRVRARGSAIFMHVARPGYTPTEGCVALSRPDLVKVLRLIGPRTKLLL